MTVAEPRAERRLARRHAAGGFALILVLWATALLSVIGAAFAFGVKSHTELTTGYLERARAGALAEAGFVWAVSALMSQRRADPDDDLRIDGTPYQLTLDSGSVQVSIVSEAGKININLAPDELIMAFADGFVEDEQAPGWGAKLLDWRDEDSNSRTDGAEDADYASAGRAYRSADQPFSSLSELSQLLGLSSDMEARVLPHLTIYSRGAKIDPLAASRAVLIAIPGLASEQVDEYLAARGADEQAAGQYLAGAAPQYLSPEGAGRRRPVFSISAIATTPSGAVANRSAVVRISRKHYQVVAWQASPRPAPEAPKTGELPDEEN